MVTTMNGFRKDQGSCDERLTAGGLPGQPPLRTWGGLGSGSKCAICAAEIRPDQCEYEFEYASTGSARGRTTVHVHVQCYSAWELERPATRLAQSKT
jgi:hypothetical protein